MRATSTPVGHSRLQPLQLTHKSNVARKSSEASASEPNCPVSARRNVFARPRVKCCSSFVARYEGHMTAASFLRHAPLLLHISIAGRNPPHSDQSSAVSKGFAR